MKNHISNKNEKKIEKINEKICWYYEELLCQNQNIKKKIHKSNIFVKIKTSRKNSQIEYFVSWSIVEMSWSWSCRNSKSIFCTRWFSQKTNTTCMQSFMKLKNSSKTFDHFFAKKRDRKVLQQSNTSHIIFFNKNNNFVNILLILTSSIDSNVFVNLFEQWKIKKTIIDFERHISTISKNQQFTNFVAYRKYFWSTILM